MLPTLNSLKTGVKKTNLAVNMNSPLVNYHMGFTVMCISVNFSVQFSVSVL